jgi:hypothetical protein
MARLPKRLAEVSMSVAGITSINSTQLANVQQNLQKVQNEFKQLGHDLQSGNLTQAQADFVTLSQSLASPPNFVGPTALDKQAGTGSSPVNPPTTVGPTAVTQSATASHHRVHLRQALNQLGHALQAGNLAAAQQAFATMSQIWQQFTGSALGNASGTQATPVNVSV